MSEIINCPFCKEEIDSEARRCQYCGSVLKKERYRDMESESVMTVETDEFNDEKRETYHVDPLPKPMVHNTPSYAGLERKGLGNGFKVFLTIIAATVPGLGQIIGVIFAIIFMNDESDADRRSFGAALLVASLAIFVLMCLSMLILVVTFGRFYNIFSIY